MKPAEFHNEVFKIVETTKKNKSQTFDLFFKDKRVANTDIDYYGNEFVIDAEPEYILDFKASQLPSGFTYMLQLPKNRLFGFMGLVNLYYDKRNVVMEYFICFGGNQERDMDINPYKLLLRVFKLLKQQGYKIDHEGEYFTENGFAQIFIKLVPNANVYEQYKNHLAVFEETYLIAEKKITDNIIRAAKKPKV